MLACHLPCFASVLTAATAAGAVLWHLSVPAGQTAATNLLPLQALDVTWGPPWEGLQPHTFDCSRLRHLPALRSLILHEFAEPCLAGLPPSLRRLTIDGGWSRGGRIRPTAFFTLPHHSRWAAVAAGHACAVQMQLPACAGSGVCDGTAAHQLLPASGMMHRGLTISPCRPLAAAVQP